LRILEESILQFATILFSSTARKPDRKLKNSNPQATNFLIFCRTQRVLLLTTARMDWSYGNEHNRQCFEKLNLKFTTKVIFD